MLARTPLHDLALSACALGISETARDALIGVLDKFERVGVPYRPPLSEADYLVERDRRGQVESFNMGVTRCGSVACLLGWAQHLSGRQSLMALDHERTPALDALFLFVDAADLATNQAFARRGMHPGEVRPHQAARALRSYLTTGAPRWAEALA